jgi:hypothetical protein
MRKKPSAIIGPTLAAVWLLTLRTAAVEFRFQGTNLDYLVLRRAVDARPRRSQSATHRPILLGAPMTWHRTHVGQPPPISANPWRAGTWREGASEDGVNRTHQSEDG